MKTRMKISLLTGTALAAMILVTACGLVTGELEEGYNLVLTVGGSAGSRSITVDYYDVTALKIEVTYPGEQEEPGEVIETIWWYPDDGIHRYVVNLGDTGDYELFVTHFSDDGEVMTEAQEKATFQIRKYIITKISITPGAVGVIVVDPIPDNGDCIFANQWLATGVVMGDPSQTADVYMNIGVNYSYETLIYNEGFSDINNLQGYSSSGTIGTDLVSSITDFIYVEGWKVYEGEFSESKTNFEYTGDSLILHQDFDGNDVVDAIWTFYPRVSENPLEGRWFAPSVLIPGESYVDAYFVFGPGDYFENMMYLPGDNEADGDPIHDVSSIGYYTLEGDTVVLHVDAILWDGEWLDSAPNPGVASWTIPFDLNNDSMTFWMDFNIYLPEEAKEWPMTRY